MSEKILIQTIRVRGRGRLVVDTALRSTTPDALAVTRLFRYDTTGGNIVANLPAASSVANGDEVIVKNEIGANEVDVVRRGER